MTQQYFDQNLKIFALNSNRPLAEKIAKHVGVDLGKLSVNRLVMVRSKLILRKVCGETMFMSSSRLLPQLMTT